MALTRITPQSTDRICALLLGPAGIGKTSQIRCLLGQEFKDGQWVESGLPPEKPLVLSAESGLLSCRDLVAAGKVDGFEIRNLDEFKEALQWCQGPEFKAAGFQWIFIDSLTEISARCAESLQQEFPSKADSFKLWGKYNSIMTDIVKTFRDLPTASVVFSCLIATEKDEFSRRFQVPDVAGSSFKGRLTSYFDESIVMEKVKMEDGGEYLAFRTTDANGLAKDRSGKLNPLEKPNLLNVKRKIVNS